MGIDQKSQPQRRPQLPQNRIISVNKATPGSVLEQRRPLVAHLGLVVNQNLQVFFHIKCCQTCSPTSYTLKINFLKWNTGLYIHPYWISCNSARPVILTRQEKFVLILSADLLVTLPNPVSSPDVIMISFLLTKVTDKIRNKAKGKDQVLWYCWHSLANRPTSHFMDGESKTQKG